MSWVWTRTKAALRHKRKLFWNSKNVHYKLVSILLYTAITAKLYICLTALSSHLRNHTASCFHTADAKVSGQLVSRTPKCIFMKLFTDTHRNIAALCLLQRSGLCTHAHTNPHTLCLCKWYVCAFIVRRLKAALVPSWKTLACVSLWAGNGLYSSVSFTFLWQNRTFPVEPNI